MGILFGVNKRRTDRNPSGFGFGADPAGCRGRHDQRGGVRQRVVKNTWTTSGQHPRHTASILFEANTMKTGRDSGVFRSGDGPAGRQHQRGWRERVRQRAAKNA